MKNLSSASAPPADNLGGAAVADAATLQAAPQPAARLQVGDSGGRLDNFLFAALRGAPRAFVYRLIRTGQVRINGRRAAPKTRLQSGDEVRLPPLAEVARVLERRENTAQRAHTRARQAALPPFLFEDEYLAAVNKPAGLAAHGGSGLSFGLVELLRARRPDEEWHLAHRLDRDTSGVMLAAKKMKTLRDLHTQMRDGEMEKEYLAVCFGAWRRDARNIRLPLSEKTNAARGGGAVKVTEEGREAHTKARLEKESAGLAVVRVQPLTGRTHQIRAHLAAVGLPIAGDNKYGDFAKNRAAAAPRLFLHACRLRVRHPQSGERLDLAAPPPLVFEEFVSRWETEAKKTRGKNTAGKGEGGGEK